MTFKDKIRSFFIFSGICLLIVFFNTNMCFCETELFDSGRVIYIKTSQNETDIQKAIQELTFSGGGVIYLDAGVWEITSPLVIDGAVSIIGSGRKRTELHAMNSMEAVIKIESKATQLTISDLSIIGGMNNNYGIDIQNRENSASTGIMFAGEAHGAGGDRFSEFGLSDTVENEDMSLKNITLEDIYIHGCGEYGVYVPSANYAVWMSRMYVDSCYRGIQMECTDSSLSEAYIQFCNIYGLYVNGGNNKINSVKSIFNGRYELPGSLPGRGKMEFGIIVEGARCTFSNIEVQDNYGCGILISGTGHLFSNLLIDANGYGSDNVGNWKEDPENYALKLQNASFCNISGGVSQYNINKGKLFYGPIQAISSHSNRINLIYDSNIFFHSENIGVDGQIVGN